MNNLAVPIHRISWWVMMGSDQFDSGNFCFFSLGTLLCLTFVSPVLIHLGMDYLILLSGINFKLIVGLELLCWAASLDETDLTHFQFKLLVCFTKVFNLDVSYW